MSDPTRSFNATYDGSNWIANFFPILGEGQTLIFGDVPESYTIQGDSTDGIQILDPSGSLVAKFFANLITASVQIGTANGSAASPSYSFSGDTNTGAYLAASDQFGIACNGANVATFTATGLQLATVLAGAYGGTGVANTGKTITVSGNTTIGSSTHTVAFATGGNTSVTLPSTGTLATLAGTESLSGKTISLVGGSAGTPALNFGSESSDSDTGLYRIGANEFGLSAGGTNVLSVSSNGAVPTPATYPKVIARAAVDQTLNVGSETTLIFGTEMLDTASIYNTSTGETTIPTNAAGTYLVGFGGIWMANGSADAVAFYVSVNGSTAGYLVRVTPASGPFIESASTVLQLSAGDVVTIRAFQNSGTAWDIIAGATISRHFVTRLF